MTTALHPALAQAYQADAIRNAPRRARLHEARANRRLRRQQRRDSVSPAGRRKLLPQTTSPSTVR